MIRHPINHLYVQLECQWLKLREKKGNIYSAKVLLIPIPSIQKYVFYRSICDAILKTNKSDVHNPNNLISKIESISTQVIQHINASKRAGSDRLALADQVTEVLEDLDVIYFILNNTSLEQVVYDRNCKDELVFKLEEHKTLYKYYFDLVSKLSHSQSINDM